MCHNHYQNRLFFSKKNQWHMGIISVFSRLSPKYLKKAGLKKAGLKKAGFKPKRYTRTKQMEFSYFGVVLFAGLGCAVDSEAEKRFTL